MLASWTSLLQPDLILNQTIIGLTPELLQKHHLRGLVLDVDETLVPTRIREASEELKTWLESMRQDVPIWLVSNNISQSRIASIGRSLNLPYVYGARKPSRRKLRLATEAMNLPISQVAMVGDRLFTDILAGNRLGMFTILVEPMVAPAEAAKYYFPLRTAEVQLSQWLGVSFASLESSAESVDPSPGEKI